MWFRATASLCLSVVALSFGEEAVASGSSHIEATTGAVHIVAETPSISFVDERDESEFHTSWRVQAQVVVDAAIARAGAEVATWRKKERRLLVPWSEDLRYAQSWAEPSQDWSLGAAPGPVRYTAPIGLPYAPSMTMAMVEIAFAEPPPKDVADALVARIVDAVARDEEPLDAP